MSHQEQMIKLIVILTSRRLSIFSMTKEVLLKENQGFDETELMEAVNHLDNIVLLTDEEKKTGKITEQGRISDVIDDNPIISYTLHNVIRN